MSGHDVFYGVTDSQESSATKVVTLVKPATDFKNGSFLLLHFHYGVPAGNVNTISVEEQTYGIVYHQYGITSAGVINAGDKVLLWCYNAIAHVIAIDRWGKDIAGKQDALPAIANNVGKVLAVNSTGTDLVWITLGYTYFTHDVDTTLQDALTLTCDFNVQAHHHVYIGSGVNGLYLIVDVRNNFENVVTVDFKDSRTETAPTLFVAVYKNGTPVSRLVSDCSSFGNTILKLQEQVNGALRAEYDLFRTANENINHLCLKISSTMLDGTTYGIVHATPMLCSDLT